VYTYLTANEMGNIPFSCPPDYPYNSTIIQDACQIRSANLVCMWLYFISLVLLILLACSIRSRKTNHKHGGSSAGSVLGKVEMEEIKKDNN
ncbi:677_t:CDS:1, partial [Scutellospora calospora]